MEFDKSTATIEGKVHHERDWFATTLILLIFGFGFITLGIYWLVPRNFVILAVGLVIVLQLFLLGILAYFRGWTWAVEACFLVLFNLYPFVFLIFGAAYPLLPSFVLIQAVALIILGQTLLLLIIWLRASHFDDPHLAKGAGWVGTFFGIITLVI
ncbi:MAG: hypothetical protein ACFFBX_09750, partial [Promethearchaeota archaeon]